MQMAPEEFDDLEATVKVLVHNLLSWEASDTDLDPYVAEQLLVGRYQTVDGRLNFWTPQIVRQLLVEWMPQHCPLPVEMTAETPATLSSLLRFLDDIGLADPRGHPLWENLAAVEEATPEFHEVIGDASRFGLAKRVTLEARAGGVDLDDDAEVEKMMQELVGADPSILFLPEIPDRAYRLPPVRLPSDQDLAAEAEHSVGLRRLRQLYEWVGEKRPEVTGPDDRLGDRDASELRTLMELPAPTDDGFDAIRLLTQWGITAELVRIQGGTLVPVTEARSILDDPLTFWHRAYDSVLELLDTRLLLGMRDFDRIQELPDAEIVAVDTMNTLYGMPSPPFPLIRLQLPYSGNMPDARASEDVVRLVTSMLGILEELGAVRIEHGLPDPLFGSDLDPDDGPWSELPAEAFQQLSRELGEPGPLVSLTPLGHCAHRYQLLDMGREAPLIGELSEVPPGAMLGVLLDHYDAESAELEIDLWLRHHEADLDDLVAAVRTMPIRHRASALVGLLISLPALGPELWQRIRSDPTLQPYALMVGVGWDAEPGSGLVGPDQLDVREGSLAFAESLLHMLEVVGPAGLPDALAEQSLDNPSELLTMLAEAEHPDTAAVDELRSALKELA